MWEDLSLEKYVMGEEKFNEKGAGRRTNLVTLEKNVKFRAKYTMLVVRSLSIMEYNLKITQLYER